MKVLEDDIGDPPTSREHQNPAPPIVTTEMASTSRNSEGNAQCPRSDGSPLKNTVIANAFHEDHSEGEYSQLQKMSIAQLKEKCKERDEKISGNKEDLIDRLRKPRKPEILIMRAR